MNQYELDTKRQMSELCARIERTADTAVLETDMNRAPTIREKNFYLDRLRGIVSGH